MARYTLYQTGPNSSSTYPECWGNMSTSPGRKIAEGANLANLMEAVDALDHDNFVIRGPGGHHVATGRKAFYAIPYVRNLMKFAKDGRAAR